MKKKDDREDERFKIAFILNSNIEKYCHKNISHF